MAVKETSPDLNSFIIYFVKVHVLELLKENHDDDSVQKDYRPKDTKVLIIFLSFELISFNDFSTD